MEFLLNYRYVLLGIASVLIVSGIAIYKFAGLPTKTQTAKIKEWLLWAVTQAEIELGKSTGTLKLRAVYNLFISRFPLTAKLVSFDTFSLWVDEALDKMRELLTTNSAVKELVDARKG